MKKLLFSLFAIMAFVACADSGFDDVGENSGNDQPQQPVISLNATAVNFTTDGGLTSVKFTASDAWTAEIINNRAEGWCSVSPTSGSAGNGRVTITATANDTTDDRTATVVIKSGAIQETITVSQKQKDAIVVAEDSYVIDREGGEIEIEVGYNIEFDITIDGDWITQQQTRSLETTKLTFVVAENTADEVRGGSITFISKDGAISQKIFVTQGDSFNNQIWYTSSDGQIVAPYETKMFDADIVSNVYENGIGVITFDGDITKIGEWAFYNCTSLTSIVIPEGVESIRNSAFKECSGLVSVNIPEGVVSIGSHAFCECGSLASINIPKGVTKIEYATFYGCASLTNIVIPDGVVSIGELAFSNCSSLTSIVIPDGVELIGSCAFQVCESLTSIVIPDGVVSIGKWAFNGCSSLASINIPEGVTEIEERTFYNCKSLTSIVIPDGVVSIGECAFTDCSSLVSINIPKGVTKIETNTFSGCESLTSIVIPEGVVSIGNDAFYYCHSLMSVYCKPTTPPTLVNTLVFAGNASGRKIYVPTASVDAYKSASYWSGYSLYIVGYDF